MREFFEAHAERLNAAERLAIWQAVSSSRVSAPWAAPRWALAAAPVLAAVVMTVAILRQEPAAPWHRIERPSRLSRTLPNAGPEASDLVVAPRESRTVPSRPQSPRPAAAVTPHGADVAAGISALPYAAPGDVSALQVPEPAQPSVRGPAVLTGRITDALRNPVPYANVRILGGPRLGALTDENGNFSISSVPVGTWQIQAEPLGYEKQIQTVTVKAGATATLSFTVGESKAVKTIEEIEVRAAPRINTESSVSRQTIPVDNLRDLNGAASPILVGSERHFRGGRGGEVKFQFDGVASKASPASPVRPAPPVIPTTGGTRLPNDEPFDSMFFRNYGVNPFVATDEDALSTFAVDVDAASYTLTRRYLELGYLPPRDAVRVEEFVNFFEQGYPHFQDEDFRILVEGAPSPFGRGYQLVRVGLKARDIDARDRKPAQLTFVIDVSGSMARENRLELVKRALTILVDQLRSDDQIGIVIYGSNGQVLLEPVALGTDEPRADGRDSDDLVVTSAPSRAGRQRVLDAIARLGPSGSTNAEEGLRLGYDMARRAYRPGANNRIVLCSDGVANVGLTGPESILAQVRTDADHGIQLTTIGFGMGNYNDVLMEQLADRGDGNHYYVDDLDEARRVFVENLTGTLQTIAKDAKVQVEFDPARVLRYRLIGFENRDVANKDFRNDKVDAGEIGAGHEVTALYEVKLAPRVQGRIATVRLRYGRPGGTSGGSPQVREIEKDFGVHELNRRFEDASPHFRLDASVAEFAEILRGSYWARESTLGGVLPVARNAAAGVGTDAAREFVTLLEKAAELSRKGQKPVEPAEER